MEPPGVLPPDRDKEKFLTQSNVNISISTSTINQITTSTSSIGCVSTSSQQTIERLSRPMAFDKMEILVKEMQDSENGVPVRSQKLFLTSIPSAFMGYDLIEWLMERLSIEESEALNIANQLCLHGYFFPVNDSKTLVVKDDSSLYRFQTPYYWPWQHKAPDNVEYAIYLAKRSLRNKQRHGLEEYETEALANLHKNLKGKWDFITMQAEEQVKLAKERKKGDKIVGDSQERAYWRVHRPPPGQFTPLEPCPVPSRDRQGKPRRRTIDDWQREVDILTASLGRTRMKMSQACECLVSYCETFAEYDPMIQQPLPSNPWVSEDITFWQLNSPIVDIPTEKRVRRWAISIEEIVSDPTGLQEFTSYLKKEYSHENIRFWLAVNDLRRSSHSLIPKKVKEIYEEFLAPGAPCEINIDGKTMENVQQGLKSPSRFAFDSAAEHIYALLLKKDCYPRFIRSEHYKCLLASGIQPSHKKRFFGFGGVAKKKSTTTAPNPALLIQTTGQSSASGQGLARRRGSDRSLSGSAHELAVSGVKDSSKVPHSHSQSNLSDIPYRGDMPCGTLPITMEISPNLNSSTTGGPFDAISNIQEAAKSFSENLETTIEGTGVSAVCPWDTNEPTISNVPSTISVSVCPWEGDTLLGAGNAAKSITSLPSSSVTSSDIKFKSSNLGIEGLGNISSDISEVSERMKRSCGLRQNTLDCDFHSTKKLMTTINEQRRASVTVAPRVSDLQYNSRRVEQHHPIDLSSSFLTAINAPKQSISQHSLILSKTKSFEEKDFGNLLKQSIVISEEDMNLQQIKNDDKINENINISNENKINTDNNDSLKTLNNSNDNILVLSSNDNIILNRSDINTYSLPVIGVNNVSLGEAQINLDVSCSACASASRSSPPIINVVTCPTIELDTRELDLENDQGNIVDSQLDEDVSISDNKCIRTTIRHDDIQVTIEPPSAFTSPEHHYKEHKLTTEQKKYSIEEEVTMHEDLSPTTEEYQECISFQNRAEQGDNDEFDLASGGDNLAPGCVAPAPTPAPSIAPLAEVEIDPPDEDGDGDDDGARGSIEVKEEDQKKKRKKRSSTDKIDSQDKPSTSDDPNKNNEQQNRYAVCPWEDEDVTASVDQPFVKTYSTLGYL